jgi:Mn-dependent DtxR family transcriptional regulator
MQQQWQSQDHVLRALDALETALQDGVFTRKRLAQDLDLSASTVQFHLNKAATKGFLILNGREKPVITGNGMLMLAAWRELEKRKREVLA